MSQKQLKALRVVLSILFLLAISVLFLDFRELIPTVWADRILWLQFVPSLIRFLTITALVSTGFIVVLILTALFGRVYCSVICPLGIFQDCISWVSKKAGLIKRYKFRKAQNILRYSLLALTLIFLAFGSMLLVNLLDPYSSFGRIFSDVFRPGVLLLNNWMAGLFEKFDWYFLYRMNFDLITWRTILIPVLSIALVLWLALYYGRLYCNTICPVGTVLGFLSRVALFRIKMDEYSCTRCGKCSFTCKSSCINVKTLEVDNSRCVACYNCISVCPESSIQYVRAKAVPKTVNQDNSKRTFLGKSITYFAALAGISSTALSQVHYSPAGKIPNKKNHPVTPPGSVSVKHFTDRCTACHLCVSVCPTKVLQPSFLEYGFMGMSQPFMDFSVEYCNYECTKCGEVCPTAAILPLTVEEKILEQTGKVNLILEKCVVYTDHTACGSCSEHCPTQAVKMVPYKDGLTIPEIDVNICIGCGACEYACPVKPHAAIFIDGNEVHQVAQAPHIEELDVQESDDFLF